MTNDQRIGLRDGNHQPDKETAEHLEDGGNSQSDIERDSVYPQQIAFMIQISNGKSEQTGERARRLDAEPCEWTGSFYA